MTSIVRRGRIIDTLPVQAPTSASLPMRVGRIEVRTGDEISDPAETNAIALEYSGGRMETSNWIQFLWCEFTFGATGTESQAAGQINMTGSPRPVQLTGVSRPPNWILDSSSSTGPWYNSGGLAVRTPTMITIFDSPGGQTSAHLAQTVFNGTAATVTEAAFVAHAETYLMQGDCAVFLVSWTAATRHHRTASGIVTDPIIYTLGTRNSVTLIPLNLRPLIAARYPAFSRLR